MNSKCLFIYDSIQLFDIFNEVNEYLDFDIKHIEKGDHQKINFFDYKNYLILITNSTIKIDNSLTINHLPKKLDKLIEEINIGFLKNKFNNQSETKIGKYILDLNSRKIKFNDIDLDLTEKECDLILFIQSNKKVTLKDLQKKVWHYSSDLETHTVETHIYRLRKKMLKSFKDNNFISFDKQGYFLN